MPKHKQAGHTTVLTKYAQTAQQNACNAGATHTRPWTVVGDAAVRPAKADKATACTLSLQQLVSVRSRHCFPACRASSSHSLLSRTRQVALSSHSSHWPPKPSGKRDCPHSLPMWLANNFRRIDHNRGQVRFSVVQEGPELFWILRCNRVPD